MHAIECPHLAADLKDLANDTAIKDAPGAKVNPKRIQTDSEDQIPLHKKAKTIQNTLVDIAVTAGKARYKHTIDLRVVELFCVRAIPAKVLDTPEWKKFVDDATKSKYNSPSSTTFMEKLVPAEAALVRSYQIKFLNTCINLTLTFDGGATRKPSSVYTVHITTADRETFFMEGCDATDDRHTAEYIEDLVTKVCCQYSATLCMTDTFIGFRVHWTPPVCCSMFQQYWQHEKGSEEHCGKVSDNSESRQRLPSPRKHGQGYLRAS